MSQVDEFSLLEYARFHGLAQNYLASDPLRGLGLSDWDADGLEEAPEAFPSNESNGSMPAESLFFDQSAMSLLFFIKQALSEETLGFDEGITFETHRSQCLKLDLPLLHTDHELDLISFKLRIVPDLRIRSLALDAVEEEVDEDFAWSKHNSLANEYAKRFESETLTVSSEALVFLQDILKFGAGNGELGSFDEGVISYKRNTARDAVTPPLLSLSPPFLPFEPSSETSQLELLADQSSPTRQQLLKVERQVYKEDALLLENETEMPGSSHLLVTHKQLDDEFAAVSKKRNRQLSFEVPNSMLINIKDLEDIYSPLKGIYDLPSSPPIKRERLDNRKLEGPLTPLIVEQSLHSKRKNVSFSEASLEIVPDLLPEVAKNEDISSKDLDPFFAEVLAPSGIKADRCIEQERLRAADTERRVSIPLMDFSFPVAPWRVHGKRSSYKAILSETQKLHLDNHFWSATGNFQQELRWNPFDGVQEDFEPQETISDDGSTEKALEQPECVDSDTLTWKPEGLRFLDELVDSDEELELGTFSEQKDLGSLVRRRALALEEECTEAVNLERLKVPNTVHHTAKIGPADERILSLQTGSTNIFAESFSALNALDKFMCIRKGEIQRPEITATTPHYRKSSKCSPKDTFPPMELLISKNQPRKSPLNIAPPNFVVPNTPHPFVVSASFLRNRKLARRIQQLYPAAEFVERDFTVHHFAVERAKSEKELTNPTVDTMANEADMILSPSTGLIWTTLQKIKQRPLPGQTACSAIRENILRSATRYERLVVLVSEDRSMDTMGISPEVGVSDCRAIAEFIDFCATIQQDTQSFFVAEGEEQLAQWIVAMMVKYGATDSELKLLQDETSWEVFLRRAGMNAFAAQIILAELQAPSPEFEQGDFGLPAFVRMSMQERFRRFEGLLGGRYLLGRVSHKLNAQ